MKNLGVLAAGALAIISAGWLRADTIPPDPTVKFQTGGGGSTDITCNTSGCVTSLSPAIGADGLGIFDIFNKSGRDIVELIFDIPNTNFDQEFNASTNAFTGASIFGDEEHNQVIVAFFGTGNADTGGSATLGANPDAPPGPPGFEPGGTITVQAFFGTPNPGTFQGFLNGQEATLALIPEPGMFWFSLVGLVGLLIARRKITAGTQKT